MLKNRNSEVIAYANVDLAFSQNHETISAKFLTTSRVTSIVQQLGSSDFHKHHEITIHFENIKGTKGVPTIGAYLNLANPDTPQDKNYLGALALYGLELSSNPSLHHDGSGQSVNMEIGETILNLHNLPNWSDDHIKLTLIAKRSLHEDAELTIGRVTVYCHTR